MPSWKGTGVNIIQTWHNIVDVSVAVPISASRFFVFILDSRWPWKVTL